MSTDTRTGTGTGKGGKASLSTTKSSSSGSLSLPTISSQFKLRFIGQYELRETLGRGMSGKVKKGVHRETGDMAALKIINKNKATKRTLSQLHTEIVALKTLNHPNVIRLQYVELDAIYERSNGEQVPSIILALQLAERGELFNYMMHATYFPELIARTFFSQLLSVLQYCHERGIFHRDIKPENLLLDHNYQLKVADFGLSAIRSDPSSLLHTECGTKLYMAPEVLAHEEYNGAKADLWSAGVLLFIMLAGNPPFQVAKAGDWWFNTISNNDYDKFWKAHKKYAPHFPIGGQEFLSQILLIDADLRPDAESLQKCSWMQSPILSPSGLRQEMNNRRLEIEAEQRSIREAEMRRAMENRQRLNRAKVTVAPSSTSINVGNKKQTIGDSEVKSKFTAVKNIFDPFVQNTYRDVKLQNILDIALTSNEISKQHDLKNSRIVSGGGEIEVKNEESKTPFYMDNLFESFQNPTTVPERRDYTLNLTSFYSGQDPTELMAVLISTLVMHIDVKIAPASEESNEAYIISEGPYHVRISNILFEAQYLNIEIRLFKEMIEDGETPFVYVCEIKRINGDFIYFRRLFNALVEKVTNVFKENIEDDDQEETIQEPVEREVDLNEYNESILTDEIGMV